MTLRFRPYPLALRHTFTVATYSRTTTPDVLVELEHDGIVGYGEASMPPYLGETVESVTAFLGQVHLEQFDDPFATVDILAHVEAVAPGNRAAKAAVDIALHDWQGRAVGLPLWRLWGLRPDAAPPTTYTIGIDTPDVVRSKVREVEGRFRRLKVKVGVEGDRALVEAIRTVTDLPLTVDANQGWATREEALDNIEWLAERGVVMVEQPLPKCRTTDSSGRHAASAGEHTPTPDDYAWLCERSPLPVVLDESVQTTSDIVRLVGQCHGINIKLMKCGGLAEARRMVTVARALGMQVMLGCMTETSCAVSAAAQLAPLADWADLDGNLLIGNDPYVGVEVAGGRTVLNDTPGIGIKLKQ